MAPATGFGLVIGLGLSGCSLRAAGGPNGMAKSQRSQCMGKLRFSSADAGQVELVGVQCYHLPVFDS